jgi:hypothetical protein
MMNDSGLTAVDGVRAVFPHLSKAGWFFFCRFTGGRLLFNVVLRFPTARSGAE